MPREPVKPTHRAPTATTAGLRSDADADTPAAWRRRIRAGQHDAHTVGCAPGYLQGNLAILPAELAYDFLCYCHYNPKPCPLIGIGTAGDPRLPVLGDDIDIRYDVPAYQVFAANEPVVRATDLESVWRNDLVSFVLGCSFSFEAALSTAGIAVRHLDAGRNVPMYRTTLETRAVGPFNAPLVVTLRAFRPADAIRAIILSERFRLAHGAPVHIGDASAIGIDRLDRPDFGDEPVIEQGDVLVFWACGVTPQIALRHCGADLVVTHDPGHMLITDLPTATAEEELTRVADADCFPGSPFDLR